MKKKLFLLLCLSVFNINNVYGYDIQNVDGENFSYQFNIFHIGESIHYAGDFVSSFEITEDYITPFCSAAEKWASIIKSSAVKPISYSVVAFNEYNAAAASLPVKVSGNPYDITGVNAVINNLNVTKSYIANPNGMILLGLGISPEHSGWAPFTGNHSLYHGEIPDLNVVFLHELMHSIGLTSYAGDTDIPEELGYTPYGILDKNLTIYTGDTSEPFDTNKEFIYQEGMVAGSDDSDFDVVHNPPYFSGEETLKVLSDKDNYDDAKQAIIENGGFINYSGAYAHNNRPKVYGLPIHPFDGSADSEYEINLSHIELRNSFMSHQDYRNWTVPMEAELAVLKDIGYNIDLRRHFGKSYYLNGITDVYTDGFSEWNGTSYTGNPSNDTQTVGIHIYGNNNNITQASDILSNGEGSFGVRIDGIANTYTLASGNSIITNGKENLALAATWGKNHVINIEQDAVVSALGEDGIAASFDFGSNIFGIYQDTRGSYINYSGDFNLNSKPDSETNDSLIDEFNVSGTLDGSKAAIYISDNAYIKNINIKDGAVINGDIISNWNSASSTYHSKVMIKDYNEEYGFEYYRPRDISNPAEILYTNLNLTGESNIKGNINGENGIFNTLILNNSGIVNFDGETIAVKTLNNNGTLNLSENVKNVGNIVNLAENSILSTQNGVVQNVIAEQLNSENANLTIDLGDTFTINNASEAGKDNANLSLIKADETTAKTLDNAESIELFTNNTLNLTGSANVYYNGNKYEISQNSTNKKVFSVQKDSSTSYELGDASVDSTTGNYIVTENALTKDAGTIKGDYFKISGNDINVNGHKGLVIDGTLNKNGTTINTSIYGAVDSNLTVQNNGVLTVNAEDKQITLGNTGETAISLNNGIAILNADNNGIVVNGAIKGNNKLNDLIGLSGNSVTLNQTDKVSISTVVPNVILNGIETNTNWIVNSGMLNVVKDSYLSSDGTNSLTFNGCGVNLINGAASNINLASLTLNDKMETKIDVDLANLTSDRFVFNNSSDVTTNGNRVEITGINILNSNTALTNLKYEIPFASSQYNSQNLAGSVDANINRYLLTPIYKYTLVYEDNGLQGNIAVNRSNFGGYNDYNPAIYTGAVGAQAGGFLSQINSYEIAFNNMDMITSMPQSTRNAMKFRNKYAMEGDGANLVTYNPNQLPQEGKGIWARPFATFESINMTNGPKVKNTAYGSYFGGDTEFLKLGKGFEGVFSAYAGYTGSHQRYDGNSVYQNGGQLGLTGVFYKNKFFTGLTANVGASAADASTIYGRDNITLLTTGVASKTGYNFGFKDDKFIIQPSWLMSYSFVNTFDYTNAAGVRVNSDPLNAIQLVPGIKFIGNLKNSWQPYFAVQMVWNIIDKAKFKANDASLEQLSIKPYVQYGIGVQKQADERLTGYAQAMMRNGGRNGIALSLGFRWKL